MGGSHSTGQIEKQNNVNARKSVEDEPSVRIDPIKGKKTYDKNKNAVDIVAKTVSTFEVFTQTDLNSNNILETSTQTESQAPVHILLGLFLS